MRKAVKTAITALVCFVLVLSFNHAHGMETSTNVTVTVEAFQITSKTADCTLKVGDNLTLTVNVSQSVSSYKWERSTDGGASWTPAATTQTCDVSNAELNTPADVPYQYRVTVTSAHNETVSAIIRILVSDDYAYRGISLRNGDTKVSSYMHDKTRLVVEPLPESSTAATELKQQLENDTGALVLYDVKLVNQNDEVVPYFGPVEVEFDVGSAYDGETLRVFHLHNGVIRTYSGIVSGGILRITVDALSPFMVEVPAANTCTLTVNTGAGGSVAPSGTVRVTDGADKTFTLLPDAGYEIDAVTVDGAPVTVTGNSFTLTNITSNHTVSAGFRLVTPSETLHTVTINAPAHGSVSPPNGISVRHGYAQTICFYPDDGYELDTVTVNGVPVNVIGNSFTLTAVTEDTSIVAAFRQGSAQPPDVYRTISASAGANGSISPMGDVRVEYGQGMYFHILPNDGYVTDEVKIDGQTVSTIGNVYHFDGVTTDRTISVTFKPRPNYYEITATAGANGSISPNGAVQVEEGASQTFSFIPINGFVVDTVTLDGTALSSPGTSYAFTNVTRAHTILVTFKPGAAPPVIYHEITVTAPTSGGTISPSGTIGVQNGGSQTINFIPDAEYVLDTVTIDGVPDPNPGSSYTFTNVTGPHTVSATFRSIAQRYTISASVSGAGGRISPEGSALVHAGGAQTFYFMPDSGYTLREVRVDGVVIRSAAYQYTFTDVRENHTLQVSFKRTATPPTGDTDSKLLWTLLIIASLLLAAVCLLYFRRLKAPDEPGAAAAPKKDEQR